MLPSIINTVYLTALTLLLAVPVGIFSAIYLAEYARKSSFFVKIINVANETLSGIPSIVYGLFGFLAFVISKKWGYSLLAGVITLAIMVLPLIIRTSQEAILGVDNSFREASYGLGAGKLRTVFKIVLRILSSKGFKNRGKRIATSLYRWFTVFISMLTEKSASS